MKDTTDYCQLVENSCFLKNGINIQKMKTVSINFWHQRIAHIDYKWLQGRFENWCKQQEHRMQIELHCNGDLANKALWNDGWMGLWFCFVIDICERSNSMPISFLFRLHNKDILRCANVTCTTFDIFYQPQQCMLFESVWDTRIKSKRL